MAMRPEKLGVDSGNGSGTAHVVDNEVGRHLSKAEVVRKNLDLCHDVSCRDQTTVR